MNDQRRLMTRPRAKTVLLWSAALLLATAVAAYGIRAIDWTAFRHFSGLDLAILGGSTLVLILFHAFGAAALLRGLGYEAGVWRVLAAMLAASTVSLAGDPKLGVPARLAFYRLWAQIPISVGTAATGIESLLWLMLMSLIVALPSPLITSYAVALSLGAMGFVASILILIAFGPALIERLWLIGPLFQAMGPIRRFIWDVRKAVLGMKPLPLMMATVWLALTYIVDIATLWFMAKVLQVDLSPLAIGHAIVISYLAGALSLLPLGLGVRDATFAVLLQQAGAPPDVAALITLAHRVLRTVVPLLLGLALSAFMVKRYARREEG